MHIMYLLGGRGPGYIPLEEASVSHLKSAFIELTVGISQWTELKMSLYIETEV